MMNKRNYNLINRFQYYAFTTLAPLNIFQQRRLFYQCTSPQKLADASNFFPTSGQQCAAYCGYDPTAESLHLGHLISIIMLVRLSAQRIKPIFLIGGATGMIGDPSGKSKQRNLINEQIVRNNSKSVQNQIHKLVQRISQDYIATNKTDNFQLVESVFVNNLSFYENMKTLQFLRDVGKNFRMSSLLNKETVSKRLQTQQGISFTQFSYSIMQAYDYLQLYQKWNCILQIGGSDQWGNITNGCQLVRKVKNQEVFGITIPLLTSQNGEKFGKSQGNALFMKSEGDYYKIYQYLVNVSDSQVQDLLYQFTFYSKQDIEQIMAKHNQNPNQKHAQMILANKVTFYLGNYENTNKQYFTLSHQQLKNKDRMFFQRIYGSQPVDLKFQISLKELQNEVDIATFFTHFGLSKGKKYLRREVQAGGLYINNKKLSKELLEVPINQFMKQNILHGEYMMVRWGKKNYNFVRFK